MQPSQGTVTANGTEIAYVETGTGPLALCLHGFPDSPATFRYLLPALAEAGYRAVAPYMRGFAPSGLAPDGDYSTGVLVRDANALHQALGGDGDAVVIGHDWGAVAAWGAPVQEPGRWRKVVAADILPLPVCAEVLMSPAQLHRGAHYWLLQMAAADAIVPAGDFAYLDHLWSAWSPRYTDAGVDLAAVKGCLRDPANTAAALSLYRSLFPPDRFGADDWAAEQGAAWGGIPSQPTLYLHGTADGLFPIDDAVLAQVGAILAKGSEAVFVDGAGHHLFVERPDEVNGRVLAFLAQPD